MLGFVFVLFTGKKVEFRVHCFFFFSYGSSLLGFILKLSEHPFKPIALLKPQGHDMPAVKLDHLG